MGYLLPGGARHSLFIIHLEHIRTPQLSPKCSSLREAQRHISQRQPSPSAPPPANPLIHTRLKPQYLFARLFTLILIFIWDYMNTEYVNACVGSDSDSDHPSTAPRNKANGGKNI